MRSEILDWLCNNTQLVIGIYKPLAKTQEELLQLYDDIFRDAIIENTSNLLYSLICIEYSRATGNSTDDFYGAIDSESLYEYTSLVNEMEDSGFYE